MEPAVQVNSGTEKMTLTKINDMANKIINDLRKRFPHVIRNYEHLIMIYENWMPAYKEMFKNQKIYI